MSRRILVIDDDPEILNIIQLCLEDSEYEVFSAKSGREGLRMAAEDVYDAVVLDVLMPDVDGLVVCRELRQMPEYVSVPVIILTGRMSQEDQKDCLDAGASRIIMKPFDSRQLLDVLEELIGI